MKTREEVQRLEKRLSKLVLEIYQAETSQIITPRYPWVLVRVLPKEGEMVGKIILPETQNKVLYEGIVLAVWKQFWIHKEKKEYKDEARTQELGYADTNVLKRSQYRVGDRILFPHFEGQPVRHLDEKNYRFVREEVDQKDNPRCGTYGWVQYDGDGKLKDELDRLFAGTQMVTMSGV